MKHMKCPECGRENVTDRDEMCPSCGFGIKEYHLQQKRYFKTKIVIGFIIVCIVVLSAVLLPRVTYDHNGDLFVKSVDTFCEDWDELELELKKEKTNELGLDIDYKVLSGDLREISELYEQNEDKDSANQYLVEKIDQYMFHQITNYNDSPSGLSYTYCDELYRFYERPTAFLGLEITNIKFYWNSDGYMHCKFDVTNNGKYSRRFMRVTVYFKDKEGNVLKRDKYGLIGSNDLPVGETRNADINSYINEDIASCDMVIDYQ